MNEVQRKKIQKLLEKYVQQFSSQAQAARRLKNVSEATVINILKGNHGSISEEMWRKVGRQVGWSNTGEWNMADTRDLKNMIRYFQDAKKYSHVFAIVGNAGCGKTATAAQYARIEQNVYHINCAEYWNKKMFLGKILHAMGREHTGYNTAEMMDEIVENIMKQDNPLILLDEADKLNDNVLYFFITLYNLLEGKCGIILLSTDYLSKRILRGYKFNKKGYAEIFSRIGRRFIKLSGTGKAEVRAICEANGVMDTHTVTEIYHGYDGDLRRVKRMVHREHLKNNR